MAQELINGLDLFKSADDGSNESGSFFHFGLNPKVKLSSISYEEGENGNSSYVKIEFEKDGTKKDFRLFLPDPNRENYEKHAGWLFSNLKHLAHAFPKGEEIDEIVVEYFEKKKVTPTVEAVVEKYIEAMNKFLDFNTELDLFLEYSRQRDGKQYLQIPLFPKWVSPTQPVKGKWEEVRDPEKGLYYVDSEDPTNIHPIKRSAKWLASDRANRVISNEVEEPFSDAKKVSVDDILGESEENDDTFMGESLLE